MRLNVLLTCAVLACGVASDERPAVVEAEGTSTGVAQFPISMPLGFGIEMGGYQLMCSPPWEGGGCAVPDNKAIKATFFSDTCSGWYQDRFYEVWDEMVGLVNDIGGEWSLTMMSSGYKYEMRCADTTGFGSFSFKTGDADTHNTQYGKLYQHKKGSIKLDVVAIESQTRWWSSTDEQRATFVRNVLRQEFLHLFGHGHNSPFAGPHVMDGPDDSTWLVEKWIDSDMYMRQWCYNEDSGLTPDCDP